MPRLATSFGAKLITLSGALSLLLCLATCALGVRSYWYSSYWDSQHYWNVHGRAHRDSYQANSYHGGLGFRHEQLWSDDPFGVRLMTPYQNGISRTELWTLRRGEAKPVGKWNGRKGGFSRTTYFGFYFKRSKRLNSDPKMTDTTWVFTVPYWAVSLLFALPPAAWLLAFRQSRKTAWRLRHERCFYCGYDLRASRGRCPECGKAPSSGNTAIAFPAGRAENPT